MTLTGLLLSLLFAGFSLPWLFLFARRGWRRPWFWLAAVIGGAGLFITLWGQPPVQRAYLAAVQGLLTGSQSLRLIVLFGVVLITGIVQEFLKAIAPALYARLPHADRRSAVVIGAASGAGFGVIEAIYLVALPIAATGMLRLAGFAIWERASAVAFHVASGALLGAGVAKGRTGRYYLLSALLHGGLNYCAILRQYMLLSPVGLEIWVTLGALLTAGVAWLASRDVRTEGSVPREV